MKTFSEFIYESSELDEIMSVSARKKQARRMAKMARSPAVKMKKQRTKLKVRPPAKLAMLAKKVKPKVKEDYSDWREDVLY